MRKREILYKYKSLIYFLYKISKIFPKKYHKWVLKKTRAWDSNLAILIRYLALKNVAKHCGFNVSVFSNVYILKPENLSIGDNVSIHPMCYIDSSGGINIGNDVSIAHSTTILSTEHIYEKIEANIKDQDVIFKEVNIKNNV